MYSIIVVDEKGKLLMRCIIWVDNRSVSWVEKIKNDMNGYEIYLCIGILIYLMLLFLKLVWL